MGWFPTPCGAAGGHFAARPSGRARRVREPASAACLDAYTQYKRAVSYKIQMLTPKGEHFCPVLPGLCLWENQSRRNRNRQNFVVGSYFGAALKSRKNQTENPRA